VRTLQVHLNLTKKIASHVAYQPRGPSRTHCQNDTSVPKEWLVYRVGQNHMYTVCIRCVYGVFGREFTIYTVIYGVYLRFWPTLLVYH